MSSSLPSRRRFLQAGAATLATTAVATAVAPRSAADIPVEPPAGTLPFLHGVASGDPIPDSVVLWTRVTPAADALPGSGLGAPVTLRWEVAADEGFTRLVTSGTVAAEAASDHTVHVDPHGLAPATVYFYRFVVTDGAFAGSVSPVGRTKTAPALGADVSELTFAVASCANWESGFFSAYRDMAARGRAGQFDATVFLGDYIYEYGQGQYSGFGPVRLHHPEHEIVSLADYRIRYGRYRTDPDLQDAHGALPWVVVWDDHETANNSWADGAENHDPTSEGGWIARRNAAMQAYFEWMPVRATSPSQGGHIYRSLTFGNLVELTMMDLRTYRSQSLELKVSGPLSITNSTNPARTMMGSEQMQWLAGKLETSAAAWNVLGNSVMFCPLNLVTIQDNPQTRAVVGALSSNISTTGAAVPSLAYNGDQWDGYAAARRGLLDLLASKGKTPLFLTGDVHSEWAHTVDYDGRTLGAELVCTSVSAPNINEELKLPAGNPVSKVAQDLVKMANPHCRHVNLDEHGYSFVRITHDAAEMHWLRVRNVMEQDSPVTDAVMLTWRRGVGFTG